MLPLGGLAQTMAQGSPVRKLLAGWRARAVRRDARPLMLDAGEGVRMPCLLSERPAQNARTGGDSGGGSNGDDGGGRGNGVNGRGSGGGARRPLAVLVHGWLGSHDAGYVLSNAATLYQHLDVARIDLVDHGGSQHLNREVYRSDRAHAQLARAIPDLLKQAGRNGDGSGDGNGDGGKDGRGRDGQGKDGEGRDGGGEKVHLVGFSLGGNLALRAAALCPGQLASLVAISPSLAPGATARAITYGSRAMRIYFTRKLRRQLLGKRRHWPDAYDWSGVPLGGHLRQLYEGFAQHLAGMEIEAYEQAHAVSAEMLRALPAPSLLVTARDDPCVPLEPMLEGPGAWDGSRLRVLVTRRGGHCAFLRGWSLRSWADAWTLQWILRHA